MTDSSHLGLGVMIQFLRGNQEAIAVWDDRKGKVIAKIEIDSIEDSGLRIDFTDSSAIRIADKGRSCCESRYMQTDDVLDDFIGAILNDIEVADGPKDTDEDYGYVHEQQFLNIHTSKGVFTCVTHNEHNGYYGGFFIHISDPNKTED